MHFVDANLATRLEQTQAWRATYYAQANIERASPPDGAVISVGGAQIVYGGPGLPVNRAIGLGLDAPVTPSDMEAIEEFYAIRQTTPSIDLCPLADASLLPLLRARGYLIERHYSVLFLPLPAELPPPNPAIRIARTAPDQADLWINTVGRGFDASDHASTDAIRLLTPNFYGGNSHCYLAWMGNAPVGGGGMYPHANVVELGGASTLLEQRMQGVQSALIRQRLTDAHALGCDLAIVLTTPGTASQRNLQRRGFHLAYTKTVLVKG